MKQEKTKKGSGRRPLYETPEEMQAAVDRYFDFIAGVPLFDKNGVPVVKRNGEQRRTGETPPTVTGLAVFLGYKDRRTFNRQAYRSEAFNDVVLFARLKIEEFYERALYDSDTFQGAAFMLNMGFGWSRKSKEMLGHEQEPPRVRIVTRKPKEEGHAKTSGGNDPAAYDLRIDLMN